MECRARADLRVRRQVVLQRVDQLIEESGDAVLEFGWRGRGNRPHRHLRPAAADELVPVLRNKRVKHRGHNFQGYQRKDPITNRASAPKQRTRRLYGNQAESAVSLRTQSGSRPNRNSRRYDAARAADVLLAIYAPGQDILQRRIKQRP